MNRLIPRSLSAVRIAACAMLCAVAGVVYGAYGGLVVATFVASVLVNDKRRESRAG